MNYSSKAYTKNLGRKEKHFNCFVSIIFVFLFLSLCQPINGWAQSDAVSLLNLNKTIQSLEAEHEQAFSSSDSSVILIKELTPHQAKNHDNWTDSLASWTAQLQSLG